MATLQRKKVGNNWYWYVVESKRVKGKPRPVVLKYIGSTEKLVKMLTEERISPEVKIKSFSYGAVYALLKVAEEIGLMEIYEKNLPEQRRDGLTVGETLLICSIYRASFPGSKRAFAEWAEGTSLPFLLGFNPKRLTSQHFWDQMEKVREEDMERIEEEIARRLVERFGISLDLLLYDVTNFYTYISTDNNRNRICKRGRNKQKRDDLRQFNLALLVSREFLIPIFKEVYEGNVTDVSSFPLILSKMRERLKGMTQNIEDITVIFDKGNYSKRIQEGLEGAGVHWVGSLSLSLSKEFEEIRRKDFYPVRLTDGREVLTYRMEKEIWGKGFVVVVIISDKLREGQIRGFEARFKKAIDFLKEVNRSRRSVKKVREEIKKILSKDRLEEVIIPKIRVKGGRIEAGWEVDGGRYRELVEEYFGRKVLFTTRKEWSEREIIEAYYGLGQIENVFRRLKDPFHLSITPEFHWTDHKIKVHTFYCVIGLILTGLLYKKVKEKGVEITAERLLDRLEGIREVLIMEGSGKKGRPTVRRQFEEMDKETMRLFEAIRS